MNNIYRNVYCGEVTKEYVGKEVRVAGWVESIRNLGSLMFMVVRDETGIVQFISNDVERFSKITKESTIMNKELDNPRSRNILAGNLNKIKYKSQKAHG